MDDKGLSRKAVVVKLKKARGKDQNYEDGKILSSMCTKPHPIAEKAYRLFLSSNIGDPRLFSGSSQIEKETITQLASLLHGENCTGFIVSGGTEANLLALLAARNISKISQPEVVLPESVHFSFTKICNILGLKPVYATLDKSFKVEVSSIEKGITENTVAIVGSAGTAELGVIDPIEEIAYCASKHNIWLHVDAAFGGLVIPFLDDTRRKFDFLLDQVKSMTVDPHKMGMAAIPAGGIIFRDHRILEAVRTETPYLADKFQYTFVGTRSGAAAASAWAVLSFLGCEGYQKIVRKCAKTTRIITEGLKNQGFELLAEPELNVIGFRSSVGTKNLAEKLSGLGWFVSYIPRYDCVRIVVMPHVKRRHASNFLEDVAKCSG